MYNMPDLASSQNLTLIHEALHTDTGLNDVDLARTLGLNVDAGTASQVISLWLGAGCN
jgi:hypothetical protein